MCANVNKEILDSFIDWLSEHETAYSDACAFFKAHDLKSVDLSKLNDWVSDHDQLLKDWCMYERQNNKKPIMYTVITLCRDVYTDKYGNDRITHPYLADSDLKLFNTKEEAFNFARAAAEEELESFTEGLKEDDECNSFNIPGDSEYESFDEVKIMCYYYDEDESDIVTRRIIKAISGE